MARPKPKFTPTPRIWSAFQVACRLGWSESQFRDRRKALEKSGFPRRDPDLKGWDSAAIEAWLDKRSGLATDYPLDLDREMDEWGVSA